MQKIAKVFASSRWAANYLKQHPLLLDELLDHRELLVAPNWCELKTQLRRELSALEGDPERQIDALRHFKQSSIFRLVAQDLDGLLPLEKVSDHLSALADLLLDETVRLCWEICRTNIAQIRASPSLATANWAARNSAMARISTSSFFTTTTLQMLRKYMPARPACNPWLNAYTGAGSTLSKRTCGCARMAQVVYW